MLLCLCYSFSSAPPAGSKEFCSSSPFHFNFKDSLINQFLSFVIEKSSFSSSQDLFPVPLFLLLSIIFLSISPGKIFRIDSIFSPFRFSGKSKQKPNYSFFHDFFFSCFCCGMLSFCSVRRFRLFSAVLQNFDEHSFPNTKLFGQNL